MPRSTEWVGKYDNHVVRVRTEVVETGDDQTLMDFELLVDGDVVDSAQRTIAGAVFTTVRLTGARAGHNFTAKIRQHIVRATEIEVRANGRLIDMR